MLLENSEQALLSCLLKKGDLIREVAIQSEHFEYVPHQKIFKAMRQLEEKNIPIDIVSVITQIGQESMIFIGGKEYISDLYNIITNEKHIKQYERYVLEEYKIRKTKELLKTIDGVTTPKHFDVLTKTITNVNELLEQDQENEFNLLDVLSKIHDDAETNKNDVNGIKTNFTELDNILDGLAEGDLTILAARPSMGKTALSLAITENVCKNDDFVDFFSLEMSDEQLLTRMICSVGGIHSLKIKHARKWFNDEDWERFSHALGIVSNFKKNLNIIDKSKINLRDIRSKIRQSKRKHPDKRHLVVIDYLTLVQGSGRKERHLEVGEISRTLKQMARELHVSVLLLAQLNRGVEQRADKRPMLSDLRDSGEIEQDADKILFLYRDDYYDNQSEQKNIVQTIVAKNRNGPLGVVELFFDKETQKFKNLARQL